MLRRLGSLAGDVAAVLVIVAFLPLWFAAWLIGGRR